MEGLKALLSFGPCKFIAELFHYGQQLEGSSLNHRDRLFKDIVGDISNWRVLPDELLVHQFLIELALGMLALFFGVGFRFVIHFIHEEQA